MIELVKSFCNKLRVEYETNKDDSVVINGDVDLTSTELTQLPFKISDINGTLKVNKNNIYDYAGFPVSVNRFIYEGEEKSYGDFLKGIKKSKEKYTKMAFVNYFDGTYGFESMGNTSTYQMGLCGLKYNIHTNILKVSLRRPGLLIGRGGRQINKLKKFLGVDIEIEEVRFF